MRAKIVIQFIALQFLTGCVHAPPDVPTCEPLKQFVFTDPTTGHTLLRPAPACMQNLGEAECGHCVYIMSGQQRFIGEAHKQIPLQELVDTGKKDAQGGPYYDWKVVTGQDGKPIMVSSWLGDRKPWSQVQAEAINCPAEECYAPLSAFIINTCQQDHCSDQVTRFKVKLDQLNGVGGAISNQGGL